MLLKFFLRLKVMPFEIFGVALVTGQPTSVIAEETYPWCTEGEIIQRYCMTREQCEERHWLTDPSSALQYQRS
jgi:hypothetical protein